MFGRSSQNKVIVFPAKNIPIGSLIQVKIKDCTSATLIGEIANTQLRDAMTNFRKLQNEELNRISTEAFKKAPKLRWSSYWIMSAVRIM